MLASSPAPQQSPIQCLQTLDQHKMKPLHTTETEIASLPDMFDQRMFTSILQQTAILVTSNRDNEQTRQTTCQPDNPQDHCFFDTAKREQTSNASITQYGFDDCPTQPVASRLTNRYHAARLQRHPPAFDACRWSNTTTEAHLRTVLQNTRVATSRSADPETTAHTSTPERHPLLRYPFGNLRDSHM